MMDHPRTDVYGNPIEPQTGEAIGPARSLQREVDGKTFKDLADAARTRGPRYRFRWLGLTRQIAACSIVMAIANTIGSRLFGDMTWREALGAGFQLGGGVAIGMCLCVADLVRSVRCRRELSAWVNKSGQDRCWYYPDIFRRLCGILDVDEGDAPRVNRGEFEDGCRRFQREEFGDQLPDHATGGEQAKPDLRGQEWAGE